MADEKKEQAAAAPAEPQFVVVHGAVSGQKDGKPHDYWQGQVVPASAFGADVERLLDCGAIDFADAE